MLRDFRAAEDEVDLRYDLCIIGAGAAGITIARQFIGSKARVCLLESGGMEYEVETQELYLGENIGIPYFDLAGTRLRFFGGSTNHWEGHSAPLQDIDFEARDWVPHSGWPIGRRELTSHYGEAQRLCKLGPFLYDGDEVWRHLDEDGVAHDPDKVRSYFWQVRQKPVVFGKAFRDALEGAANVDVLLHANVTRIQSSATANSVEHVEFRSLEGKRGRVAAEAFVLACGGLENPRVLLLSNDLEATGLGNGNDLVGRFFMEHPHTRTAAVASEDPRQLVDAYISRHRQGVRYRPGVCPSKATQRREKITNSSLLVSFEPEPDAPSFVAEEMFDQVANGEIPDRLGEKTWRVLKDLDLVLTNTYRRYVAGKGAIPKLNVVYLRSQSEQSPNPESRVTLSQERDALGLRRIELDWRMTELDKRSVRSMTTIFGAELARLGLARIRLDDWLMDGSKDWSDDLAGGHHHMGTTRMADDPKAGVVDRNCKVHGHANLYIAGSSVFPTGGYANPTLTIVALALRLAEHLKHKLAA